MSQENAVEKSEGTPKKRTTLKDWVMSAVILWLCALLMVCAFRGLGPLNTTKLEGIAVILDENGEAVPYRDITFTFYSHYAPGFFRSELSRERNYYIDEHGFGRGFPGHKAFPLKIPNSGATLFFHTRNGRYAAVVDIDRGDPTTGLVVELRPRHSTTGRLVDSIGAPLANHEFSLEFNRTPDFPRTLIGYRGVTVKTFEYEYCATDADGYFSVERLIPGLEYQVSIHVPSISMYAVSVKMPILQPEQYQEPYDLGDVVVRRF